MKLNRIYKVREGVDIGLLPVRDAWELDTISRNNEEQRFMYVMKNISPAHYGKTLTVAFHDYVDMREAFRAKWVFDI